MFAHYDYTIVHISGERHCWGDLLSRWVNVPAVAVRAVTVFASSALDEIMPSEDAICKVQQKVRASLSVMIRPLFVHYSGWSRVEGQRVFFRMRLDGRDVLGIPEQANGTRPGEVLYFDYLYVGDSGSLGKDGLDEEDGFKYILVIMDDLSNFVWLEPTESCTEASTVKHLLRWCKTLGVPDVWMSDTASHFKNRVIKTPERELRVEHRFAVAISPWSNGTCERMMREVVRAFKAVSQEERRDIRERMDVVPAVKWALNTAYRERYASTPYHVMFGRASMTSFLALASSTGEDWKVDALDEEA